MSAVDAASGPVHGSSRVPLLQIAFREVFTDTHCSCQHPRKFFLVCSSTNNAVQQEQQTTCRHGSSRSRHSRCSIPCSGTKCSHGTGATQGQRSRGTAACGAFLRGTGCVPELHAPVPAAEESGPICRPAQLQHRCVEQARVGVRSCFTAQRRL